MPQSLTPLAISAVIFLCTFAAAILGMALRRRLPDDQLSEDSKDVIQLIMGLIATMAALVLGLLIASANSSYQTESDELQRASASIVELGSLLAHYGPEASESRHRPATWGSYGREGKNLAQGCRHVQKTRTSGGSCRIKLFLREHRAAHAKH